MTIEASANKKTFFALTITLISLLVITSVLTFCSLRPSVSVNTEANINWNPMQSSNETNLTGINEITSVRDTASYYQGRTSSPHTLSTFYPDNSRFATNRLMEQSNQFSFYFNTNIDPIEIAVSDGFDPITVKDIKETESLDIANSSKNDPAENITLASMPFSDINFATYTYGGYPIQQPEINKFFFSFPDNTNEGQIAGSDAITVETHLIKKMEFNAEFISPNISAQGFDEMVVFAASDTTTYKGVEFGIRMDLCNGFIYGYNQEPNGNYLDVNFKMCQLMPNDGLIHHYSLVMIGSEVTFCIDGTIYGYLDFSSKTDYSSLNFSILAVVHRFTDDWDSTGYTMKVENFTLNQ